MIKSNDRPSPARRRSLLGLALVVLTPSVAAASVAVSASGPAPAVAVLTEPPTCPNGGTPLTLPEQGLALCETIFTSSGTFALPTGVTSVDVMVVGGGGGGGVGGVVSSEVLAGGGGGGAQVALYEGVAISGDVSVTVGAGGTGGVDPCDPTCGSGGADGSDGGTSEFGTGGTYVALGGEGGLGGGAIASTPFVASGAGGGSPVVASPTLIASTFSPGGSGGAEVGALMGDVETAYYFSGAGGGAGAGGDGYAASLSGCAEVDGYAICSIIGGNGGSGVIPEGGLFEPFWFFQFDFLNGTDVGTMGFGPGGGGAVAAMVYDDLGTEAVGFTQAGSVNLSGERPVGSQECFGAGAVVLAYNSVSTYTPPNSLRALATGHDCAGPTLSTFGGGGGGAAANADVTTSTELATGASGSPGVVVVRYEMAIDGDNDGYLSDVECDDTRPTVNPGATELFGNGLDDDCTAATPGFSNEVYTCVSPDASASVVENGFQQLVFSKAEDLGEPADEGDAFRYLQVAAIGGPTFATGEVTAVSGSGPWTVTVDVSDTSALTIGDAVTSIRGTGRFGNGGVYTITSVVDADTFELEASADSSSPTVGTITSLRTGQRVDAMVTVVENDETSIDKLDDWSSNGTSNARIDVESEAFGYSATGTVGNITGSGPWTAEITDLESTEGLMAGMRMFADDTIGSIGADGIYVIEEILSPTSLRYSATGGVAPEEGSINEFAVWSGFQLRIDFLAGGTDTPITVDDVALTIRDVDDLQYTEFTLPDALRLEDDSRLEIFSNEDLDVVPSDSLRVWSAHKSSSADPRNWVEVRYFSTDSISLRLGQLRASSANFGLNFVSDSFDSPIDCTVNLDVTVETALTYTGDSGVVLAGTPVTLSSVIDPAECTTPEVTYELVYPDGSSQAVTSPLDTTGLLSGIYEIVASYAGDGVCLPSEDRAVLVVTSSADTVTGGGVYHVDSDISGSPRVHFGFTVQKTDKLDRRTGVRTITQRGQLLWINNNEWRLKSALYARWTDSGGVISGDRPVFGTVPCPVGVGASGSNPRCGVIAGGGWLERWNSDTLTWDVATDLGDEGWVTFSATVYDGGKVSVCKGKRNCTIVDVADWFGMAMQGITADDETGVPVTEPIAVRKQRNGAIVIRS